MRGGKAPFPYQVSSDFPCHHLGTGSPWKDIPVLGWMCLADVSCLPVPSGPRLAQYPQGLTARWRLAGQSFREITSWCVMSCAQKGNPTALKHPLEKATDVSCGQAGRAGIGAAQPSSPGMWSIPHWQRSWDIGAGMDQMDLRADEWEE